MQPSCEAAAASVGHGGYGEYSSVVPGDRHLHRARGTALDAGESDEGVIAGGYARRRLVDDLGGQSVALCQHALQVLDARIFGVVQLVEPLGRDQLIQGAAHALWSRIQHVARVTHERSSVGVAGVYPHRPGSHPGLDVRRLQIGERGAQRVHVAVGHAVEQRGIGDRGADLGDNPVVLLHARARSCRCCRSYPARQARKLGGDELLPSHARHSSPAG